MSAINNPNPKRTPMSKSTSLIDCRLREMVPILKRTAARSAGIFVSQKEIPGRGATGGSGGASPLMKKANSPFEPTMNRRFRLDRAVMAGVVLFLAGTVSAIESQPGTNQPVVRAVADGIWRVQIGDDSAVAKISTILPQDKYLGKDEARVTIEGGRVIVRDAAGKVLVTQISVGPSVGNGSAGIKVVWESGVADSLYGMGSFQDGHFDIRGTTLQCYQKNTEDTVPLVVSSGGFGILWDNPAPFIFTGDAGARTFSLDSKYAGIGVCYYVLAGSPDEIIAKYRRLSGAAPMFPKWAFGYHQSKERYCSQAEVLAIAKKFRETKFPLDLIIQDWRYWGEYGWNACKFDPDLFPDAKAMMEQLHNQNLHLIVSVWPSFLDDGKKGSEVFKELEAGKYLTTCPAGWHKMRFYDVFSSNARKIVWKYSRAGIFDLGVDGWWLDATEPEMNTGSFGMTEAGPMTSVANAYPFYAVKVFHDGQRAATSDKRVFILTRSAYTGLQRLAACYWTGDTDGTWATLRKQIPACLSMSISGIPYVNTDIGGFTGGSKDPDYRELFVRWFQFGTFCPEMRAHGTGFPREPWVFGEPGSPEYDTLLAFTKLRYNLLPYIYSTPGVVTNSHDTLMRPLVMDFPEDLSVRSIGDQYMFGRSLLVSPVLMPKFNINKLGSIIPSTSLYDSEGKIGGLSATYFKGINFETKVLTRKDSEIRFNWSKTPRVGMGANLSLDPIPELGDMDKFSARWEGSVQTDQAGEYTFSVKGDDGYRLFVDGKMVFEDWVARSAVVHGAKVNLPANTRVPVKLEYFQDKGDALIELGWAQPAKKSLNADARQIVLPKGADWYDFWTNSRLSGGQTLSVNVPIQTMPLHVRAGSILPFGPDLQYTSEVTDKPTELRVYPGADGEFVLYDDAGDGYGYEKGQHAMIPLKWNNKSQILTIGERVGTYPGMAEKKSFLVRLLQPTGAWRDQPVLYTGKSVILEKP